MLEDVGTIAGEYEARENPAAVAYADGSCYSAQEADVGTGYGT
jgi:hypothetical protein